MTTEQLKTLEYAVDDGALVNKQGTVRITHIKDHAHFYKDKNGLFNYFYIIVNPPEYPHKRESKPKKTLEEAIERMEAQ